ncbi:MAG TPA: DUF5681 domain-containing protein [Rhizomicrobium sp.]|nr:DUF5681 domain-containing protein [Rhizomicrobium sp.]
MEKIGYKRPPIRTQFAKGKSGNPKGRPKGANKINSLANIVNQQVTMTIDGVPRKVPLNEATVIKLFQSALNGNTSAARLVLQLIEKAEQKQMEEKRNPLGPCPPIERVVLCGPDFDDCSDALFKLGAMHATREEGWRLETWVVEAAFARNMHSARLRNEEDYQDIAKAMAKPEDLPALRGKCG